MCMQHARAMPRRPGLIEGEAIRDLLRAREAAVHDLKAAKHRRRDTTMVQSAERSTANRLCHCPAVLYPVAIGAQGDLHPYRDGYKYLISCTRQSPKGFSADWRGFSGAGLARVWACRRTNAAQRLGLGEDQTAAERNRAFGNEQRLEPFNRRREIRAAKKTRGVFRPRRNR
jgi:hypothetical protein